MRFGTGMTANFALSADARIVLAGMGQAAELWDTTTGQRLGSLTGHDGVVKAVAFGWAAGRC